MKLGKTRCCSWYSDGIRLSYHGSLICIPWYFKVLSWYMVIHGTFLLVVLRWDTEFRVDMDKMFHAFHIFSVKWSLGQGSVFKH